MVYSLLGGLRTFTIGHADSPHVRAGLIMRVAGLSAALWCTCLARSPFHLRGRRRSPAGDFMETTAATERLPAGAAAIFVDSEYVAALPLLSRICEQQGIDLRSYASEDHPMASRATHTIQSKERGAVNTQMIWGMAMYCSDKHQVAQILLVTDDHLGNTLASLGLGVSWASLELDMPQPWRRALGGSAKDFFARQVGEQALGARSRSRRRSRLSCGGRGSDGDGSGGEGNGGVGGGGEGAGGSGGGGGGDSGGGEGGGGPRNGQEAARAEVHPRSRRVGRAAGAPALVSLFRQAVLRRGAAGSPDVTDRPDASSPAAAPPASAPPAAAAPPAQTQTPDLTT